MSGADEAAAAWIDATLDAGGTISPPGDLGALRDRPEFAGWSFGVVTLDPAMLDDTTECVNITCPAGCLGGWTPKRVGLARAVRGTLRR